MGFGIECTTARSRWVKNSGVGSALTERIAPPAIRKPKAWMGYEGLGTMTTSPGAVIACAMLAKPSFEPSVATTCVSGLSFTPKRRS